MPSGRGQIVVFAKAPRPGLVKTRMVPPLSPEQAAQLYASLLGDVLRTTADFARDLELDPVVTLYPAEACHSLARDAPTSFRLVPQRGRNLAQRMAWAVAEAAASGAERVLLRGSDSPVVDRHIAAAALDALAENDLVVCPDRDGGYNLIGLRAPAPGLFDHPMSTRSVLDDTLANAERLGLRAHVLDASFDLDTIEDLRWLAEARCDRVAKLCPATLAYLDENDLWRFVGVG